jgi:outer membrane protein OmpA-like peptidoglycan-associated protein
MALGLIGAMLMMGKLSAQVQDQLKLKLERSVYLKEKLSEMSEEPPYLEFPNIGKSKGYFPSKDYKRRIAEAETKNDLLGLDSLLVNFVRQWDVGNFNQDLEFLWKAGQVKELMGDSIGAQMYYEMGLKNQRPWKPKVKLHYDSLRVRQNVEWVDLNFYYKILEARRKVDPLIPPKGVMLNMGPKVNSERPDYAPFMHPSDSVLIFTSRRNEEIIIDDIGEQKNEDLFFVEKDFVDGTWNYAKRFTDDVNSKFNEGSAALSPDGRTLIFTRCDADDGFGSCDLYIADFIGSTWANIRNIGPMVNSDAWDSHPNITPDGKTLYFTSNRKGGFGKSDLYRTTRQEDGTWTQAENLGPIINTVEEEVTPFFHEINQTLYFSSTGHLKNMGGFDIYKSRWMKDHWESPKNVGPLVNSSGNEYYFTIDGKGTRLFYASAKKDQDKAEVNQNFDLYSFPMPMEARPDAIMTLRGFLVDSITGYPITGIVLVVDKDQGIEVAPKYINKFGYFEFDLINNHRYDIYIQGENFMTIKESLVMSDDTSFAVVASSFESGKPIVFENLEFEANSTDLNASIEPKLNYLIAFLQRYPMYRLTVKGHTDSQSDARYNLDLSRKRAATIRKYIVKAGGIAEDRVMAEGYGETRPLVPNDTEENRRTNRRVEFEMSLDPTFKGDWILPTAEELAAPEDEEQYDPEFMQEFDWQEDAEDLDMDWELQEDEDSELLQEFDDVTEEDIRQMRDDEEDEADDLPDEELDP